VGFIKEKKQIGQLDLYTIKYTTFYKNSSHE